MAANRQELRHFLYLDDNFVRELLAQLEEGEFDEYQYQQAHEKAVELGGRAGLAGVGASAGRDSSDREEVTYSRRLTPASQVARLVRLLSHGGLLKDLGAGGEEVRLGEIILATGRLQLTGLTRIALGFRELDRSERLFAESEHEQGGQVRQSVVRELERIARRVAKRPRRTRWSRLAANAAELEGPEVAVVMPPSATSVTILARLKRPMLRIAPAELEVDASILGKVIRVLEPGEDVEAASPFPGARPLGDAFLAGLADAEDASQFPLGPVRVSYPAFLVAPLAIFQ